MRKLLTRLGWTFLAVAIAIQFYRPARENPPEAPGAAIEAHVPANHPGYETFSRACMDCHSDRTDWPWYSNIAPASWFVAGHVDHARSHLNISRWSQYNGSNAAKFLGEMCEEATEREMPLPSYLILHPEARLTDDDIESLCLWAESARKSIIAQEAAREAAAEAPSDAPGVPESGPIEPVTPPTEEPPSPRNVP